jgi:hypothetical protein
MNKLSASGYSFDNVFSEDLLTRIRQYITETAPTNSQPWHLGGHRLAWYLLDPASSLRNLIGQQALVCIEQAVGAGAQYIGIEIWQDHSGYENHWHNDDPNNVQNIFVVYMGNYEHGIGTTYKEDNQTYSVPYQYNTALLLTNSDKIQHAMVGQVPADFKRLTVYINFKK